MQDIHDYFIMYHQNIRSHQLLLDTYRISPKLSSKFVSNFLSYRANRQTDKQTAGKT